MILAEIVGICRGDDGGRLLPKMENEDEEYFR
jgi:hypothetical protein